MMFVTTETQWLKTYEYCNTNNAMEHLLCYCIKSEDTRRNLKIVNNIQSLLTNKTQCKIGSKLPKRNRPAAPFIEMYELVT